MNYFNPTNNECLETCKGLENLEFANKIESDDDQEKCRNKCNEDGNTHPYYESGTNICIGNCDTSDAKKFRANDGNVCYSSCAEIPGGEYIYELSYLCYKSISEISESTCQYYYIKANKDK